MRCKVRDRDSIRIDMGGGIVKTAGEKYAGSYDVIPRLDEGVVLETENKILSDNVRVWAIPWEEVSNPQGGITVTIGGY